MDSKEIRRANMLLLAERVGNLRKLADFTETDPTYLSNVKNRVKAANGEERGMGDKVARRFERKFEQARGWMDVLQDSPSQVELIRAKTRDSAYVRPGVPVVGTAQLGDDGYWHELEYPVGQGEGFVRYPTADPNTYALRVKGDSMWPRIKPGEFVVIEPNGPLITGEEVMVQTVDGRSMIKLLISQRDGLVELHSINGEHKPITLESAQIAKMHYVGGILKKSRYYESVL